MDKPRLPRVLIVDDAAFMRGMIRYFLSQGGFDVCGEACSGSSGIQQFRECAPDVVIMDIIMPDMSGVEAVREIRKLNPKAKILMLSAVSNKPVVSLALEAGADAFLPKPFKRDALINKLIGVLKSS